MVMEIKWDEGKLQALTKRNVEKRLKQAAIYVEGKIKDKLNQKGTGIEYGRGRTPTGRKRKSHIASAPGNPPAVDTGRLRSSITYEVTSGAGSSMGSQGSPSSSDKIGKVSGDNSVSFTIIGTNVGYAKPLEFGTVHIKPRPFLRKTLEEGKSAIKAIFEQGGS